MLEDLALLKQNETLILLVLYPYKCILSTSTRTVFYDKTIRVNTETLSKEKFGLTGHKCQASCSMNIFKSSRRALYRIAARKVGG